MRPADCILKPCPRCSEGIPALPRPCHHCKATRPQRRRRGRHYHCVWCRDTGELRGPLACPICRGSNRVIVGASRRAFGERLQQSLALDLARAFAAEREGWQKGGEGIFTRNAWDPVD